MPKRSREPPILARPELIKMIREEMLERPRGRRRGTNQLARNMATGQAPPAAMAKTDEGKTAAAGALGRLGGLKGGKARAASLRKKARSEIAKRAAKTRWSAKVGKPKA
jgi:hypothetical protein